MRSSRSIHPTTVITRNGSTSAWPFSTALKDLQSGVTYSTPGLKGARIMAGRKLPAKNGAALVDARDLLESLLLRYLSKPKKPDGPALSTIFLSSHLAIVVRRHPAYRHLSRQKIHQLVTEIAGSQLSLFYP